MYAGTCEFAATGNDLRYQALINLFASYRQCIIEYAYLAEPQEMRQVPMHTGQPVGKFSGGV